VLQLAVQILKRATKIILLLGNQGGVSKPVNSSDQASSYASPYLVLLSFAEVATDRFDFGLEFPDLTHLRCGLHSCLWAARQIHFLTMIEVGIYAFGPIQAH
jgi:hypothetical protein